MKKLLPVIFLAILGVFAFNFFNQVSTSGSTSIDAQSALSSDDALYIIAGSELKDLEPYLDKIRRKTGVTLSFKYSGTLDGVDSILAGEKYDAAWFSHGKYLSLSDRSRIKSQEQIMLSPVVMGVKQSKAQAWGWDNKAVTWADIAEKAESGELQFAMTNPSSSNSGFTALMGVTAAFAGTSDAPKSSDIEKAAPQLKRFFKGQKLTSGSSGWLASQYVKEQGRLNGMVNYESVLMQLNASGELREPLHLLYPTEGIVTADYPLMLLNADKKSAFSKVVEYLKSEDFQTVLMDKTDRRPVNIQVGLDKKFHQGLLVELPFPSSSQVIDDILFAYLDDIRIPAHAVFVLDTSGSMAEEGRMTQLKSAMHGLIAPNTNSASKFARFLDRERVSLLPFSSYPKQIHSYELSKQYPKIPEVIGQKVDELRADGGTAIYDALITAYKHIQNETTRKTDDRYYSVVLMTDGENTKGSRIDAFEDFYRQLPDELKRVKVFTVLFGKADEQAMRRVSELTGGRTFDGRKGNLSQVFKKIRGYQ